MRAGIFIRDGDHRGGCDRSHLDLMNGMRDFEFNGGLKVRVERWFGCGIFGSV